MSEDMEFNHGYDVLTRDGEHLLFLSSDAFSMEGVRDLFRSHGVWPVGAFFVRRYNANGDAKHFAVFIRAKSPEPLTPDGL